MRKGLLLLLAFLLLSACTNAEVPVVEISAPQKVVEATKEKQETVKAARYILQLIRRIRKSVT